MSATTTTPITPSTTRLHRRLAPLYAALLLQNLALWVPIEKLFMDEIGFDPASVGIMAAAYALVAPSLEIPSGIMADRWSRRGVLVVGNVALLLSVLIGGLSTNVGVYIVAAMFLGVFFAMQSGTLEAVVYDTVTEETGGSDGFERLVGRLRMTESVALVASALAGGLIASLTSARATYFITLPFVVLSLVALAAFREPRLHKSEEPVSLRSQIGTTYRTILQRGRLLPIFVLMMLTGLLMNLIFEFGPIWLVALAAPAILYGPHWAGLTSALGLGGFLAGRLQLSSPRTLAAVVALMVATSAALVVSHDAVVIIAAQVVLLTLLVSANVFLMARLHEAIPSSIRAGVASGVGTFTWIGFLPTSLVFGFLSRSLGVHTAGLLVVGLVALTGALLVKLALDPRTAGDAVESHAAVEPELELAEAA